MRKTFITTVDPTYGSGQNIFAYNLIKTFDDLDSCEDCIVFACRYPNNLRTTNTDVKVLFRDTKFKWLKILLFQFYLCIIFIFRKDTYYVFSMKPYFFSATLLAILGRKYSVITEGNMKININKSYKFLWARLFLLLITFVIRRAQDVSSCYESGVNWVNTMRDSADCKWIPCGISNDQITIAKSRVTQGNFDIGYVGSFRDVHNLDKLIEFALKYNLKVKLVGTGHEFERITKFLKSSNLMGQFHCTGFVESDLVKEEIIDCKVMWALTTDEYWGLPMKIVEYLAAGKPVISNFKIELKWFENLGVLKSLSGSCSVEEIYEAYTKLEKVRIDDNVYQYLDANFSWKRFNELMPNV